MSNSSPGVSSEWVGAECDDQFRRIMSDIHVMVAFAMGQGKTISQKIAVLLAELCYGDEPGEQVQKPPIGAVAETGAVAATRNAPNQALLSKALEVHSGLSQLIYPATATTVRASKTDGKIWIDNVTLRFLLANSIVMIIVFLFAVMFLEFESNKGVESSPSNSSKQTNSPAITNKNTP